MIDMKTSIAVTLVLTIVLMFGQVWALKRGNEPANHAAILTGMVTDEDGDGMIGVKVSILDKTGKVSFTEQTNDSGLFEIENIPAGDNYTVVFSSNGFSPVTFENIELHRGDKESFVAFMTER